MPTPSPPVRAARTRVPECNPRHRVRPRGRRGPGWRAAPRSGGVCSSGSFSSLKAFAISNPRCRARTVPRSRYRPASASRAAKRRSGKSRRTSAESDAPPQSFSKYPSRSCRCAVLLELDAQLLRDTGQPHPIAKVCGVDLASQSFRGGLRRRLAQRQADEGRPKRNLMLAEGNLRTADRWRAAAAIISSVIRISA